MEPSVAWWASTPQRGRKIAAEVATPLPPGRRQSQRGVRYIGAVRGAPPLRKKVVSSQRTTKARKSHSLPLLAYSAPGGLRQDPGRATESAAGSRTDED